VLLSSVTPGELMLGKLGGIAAVGLTMVGSWFLAVIGILSWTAGAPTGAASSMLQVLHSSHLIPMFLLYFLFGYIIYAALILALGSVCNTLKEAQSYMGMITMFMMVPLLTLAFIPKDPNGMLARCLSWVPLYTPFIMMNRVMADPPWIDLIGTFLLLVATAAATLWMAGKVFRIGILRTGQPPRLLELLRWLRRRP
jgi:ABC-2 type transport system permease protein